MHSWAKGGKTGGFGFAISAVNQQLDSDPEGARIGRDVFSLQFVNDLAGKLRADLLVDFIELVEHVEQLKRKTPCETVASELQSSVRIAGCGFGSNLLFEFAVVGKTEFRVFRRRLTRRAQKLQGQVRVAPCHQSQYSLSQAEGGKV